MNERPTPETDAFIASLNDEWDVEFAALTAHAKKIERERDEAREGQMEALCDFQRLARKIDDIRDVFDHQDEDWTGSIPLADAVSKVIRERDEAREDTPWHANGETKDEWFARQREKYAVIERERDEAREKCRGLEGWKESAMHVLGEWERVWEAAGRPGRLGASKADSVRELILSNNVLNNKEATK